MDAVLSPDHQQDCQEKLYTTLGSDSKDQSDKDSRSQNTQHEKPDSVGGISECYESSAGVLTSISADGNTKSASLQTSMNAPVIMLTASTQRGIVEASVLLNPASGMSCTSPLTSIQLCNLHSLAQANLISDTQDQIVKQLSAQEEREEGTGKREKGSGCDRLEKQSVVGKIPDKEVFKKQKQIAIIEPRPNEPKSFVCQVKGCGRKFAWPAHFKYHQLTHTNDRQFVCEAPGCGKRFMTAQSLQVHSRTHTGEKPFVCPVEDCGKSFTTAGNLRNHSRIHTGEKPYHCEQCGRRFAEYSSLHKHSLTHSGAKPFSCEICGKSFSQSGSRRVHMNRHKIEQAKQAMEAGVCVDDVTAALAQPDSQAKVGLAAKVEPPNDVLVLCNSQEDNVQYQDLQNADSVVFPQGLDHVVTVTTQPAEGENETLGMTHDILGAEEVLGDDQMTDSGRVGSSVVVLSQPSEMDSLTPSYHHSHDIQNVSQPDTGHYDHNQLLHPDLHHEEITTSDDHDLTYTHLEPPSQDGHDRQTVLVAVEVEVGVTSSSSSHPQSTQNIHMDPMMESDEESDSAEKHAS